MNDYQAVRVSDDSEEVRYEVVVKRREVVFEDPHPPRTAFVANRRALLGTVLALLVLALSLTQVSDLSRRTSLQAITDGLCLTQRKEMTRKEKIASLYGMDTFQSRSWLDHLHSLVPTGLAPATVFTQEYLYNHQNPPLETCSEAQFLVLDTTYNSSLRHGLGSTIHVTSYSLMRALEASRILMWSEQPYGYLFVDEDCRADGIRSLDCIFEPLSHCPRSSMNENNTVKAAKFGGPPGSPKMEMWEIPTVFKEKLKADLPFALTQPALKFWWRGQAAAYLMRIRREGLAEIAANRLDPTAHSAFTRSSKTGELTSLEMPFPLHPGTQSFHIRHGDKGGEMTLLPLEDYMKKGEDLAQMNPHGLFKMAFVSSEDPIVFEKARRLSSVGVNVTAPNTDWLWYTSNIQRANGGPFTQLDQFGNRTQLTLSWMSELFLALEADAFIGQLASNWNRIIAELRCVWVDKCLQTYVEVGPEKDSKDYNW